MRASRIATAFLFMLVISGCTTYSPIPEGYVGPVATIEDTYTNKTEKYAHFFMLEKIAQNRVSNSFGLTRKKNVGRGTEFEPVMASIDVLPESTVFTISGFKFYPTDAQLLFANTMSVTKEVSFSPEPGQKYFVKGELSKNGSEVWLEDSYGKIVPESK